MELNENKWMPCEDKWISYEKTETYQNYIIRNSSANEFKEEKNMELELYNQSTINYGKTLSAISFFSKSALGKFTKKDNWKLKVWLGETNAKVSSKISCGIALIRPRKSKIYTKKVAGNFNEAIKQSLNVIEKSIRREKSQWARD